MAEAAEVGHWSVLRDPERGGAPPRRRGGRRLGDADPGAALQRGMAGSLTLAAEEDPNEVAGAAVAGAGCGFAARPAREGRPGQLVGCQTSVRVPACAPSHGGRPSTDAVTEPALNQLRAIRRTQLSEEVESAKLEAIRSGDFASGERLPSERKGLVATFGVSRVSIREAIRSLEGLGLVRVYQGRGAFVTDRRSGFGEPIARWLDIHRDEILELLDVRAALDGFAVECAVRRDDPDGIAAIVSAQALAFAQAVEEGAETAELVGLDIDFHLAIADAAGNRLLRPALRRSSLSGGVPPRRARTRVGRPSRPPSTRASSTPSSRAMRGRPGRRRRRTSPPVRELLAAQLDLDGAAGTTAV